jgi:hypothetical protein
MDNSKNRCATPTFRGFALLVTMITSGLGGFVSPPTMQRADDARRTAVFPG